MFITFLVCLFVPKGKQMSPFYSNYTDIKE